MDYAALFYGLTPSPGRLLAAHQLLFQQLKNLAVDLGALEHPLQPVSTGGSSSRFRAGITTFSIGVLPKAN
jgi:hypothetical protein